MAYTLIKALQRMALIDTSLAKASPNRIRLSLLKIGAQVTISARRIPTAIACACPHKGDFVAPHAKLATVQGAF